MVIAGRIMTTDIRGLIPEIITATSARTMIPSLVVGITEAVITEGFTSTGITLVTEGSMGEVSTVAAADSMAEEGNFAVVGTGEAVAVRFGAPIGIERCSNGSPVERTACRL